MQQKPIFMYISYFMYDALAFSLHFSSPLGVPANKVPIAPASLKPEAVELEPFYYGQIQGDSSLGREINSYSFTCHQCNVSTPYSKNEEIVRTVQ